MLVLYSKLPCGHAGHAVWIRKPVQEKDVPQHWDRVVHVVEYLVWLMTLFWMGLSSSFPYNSELCFTMAFGLVLACYHGLGTILSRLLASLFWKARGFNGTDAVCFMVVGLSPRQFPWAYLFMPVDVITGAVLPWRCAMVGQHAKAAQAQRDAGVTTLLEYVQRCNIAVLLTRTNPFRVGLYTASCTCWWSVDHFPLLNILRLLLISNE